MKWFTTLTAALLPATALARVVSKRDDRAITDSYLFEISLDEFITNRNALNPPTLDWESDGCTASPDNPLGFDFLEPCNRHDFGYGNYRLQARFTETAKASIDSKFLADMRLKCESEGWLKKLCNAFADVYYAAVRAFGGLAATPGKRISAHEAAVAEYEAKLATYNALLAEARANGDLERAIREKSGQQKE